PRRPPWLRDEPGVRQAIDAGAALVTFSGDKLLGGPQAGVVVGRADLAATLAGHPLARAVRADKLTLAALQAVAFSYLSGDATTIPLWRMATAPLDRLRARAEAVAAAVPGAKVVDTDAVAGGGSLPGLTIPSVGVAVDVAAPAPALTLLREHDIVARVEDGAVVCDLRTVDPADDERVARALAASG
ncbi:MAG TPA: L-seryl-tRNA(Sec) selenium transferase, partial [Acidimicrobiia bacterium]|nr:L-seryl-tRNA(Sec) selenium transferase [Acidimicrobiia bacterium]